MGQFGPVRQVSCTASEGRREPSAAPGQEVSDACLGIQVGPGQPNLRTPALSGLLEGDRATVVTECGKKKPRHSVSPVAQISEPLAKHAIQNSDRLGDVARGHAETIPPIRLETDVELAQVVEGCQDGEPGSLAEIEWLSRESVEPGLPHRQGQESLGDRRHVSAMVH